MKITYVKNPLRKAVESAPALLAQTALGRAETNLAAIKGDCIVRLDELLADFQQPEGEGTEAIRVALRSAYDIARRIVGVGSVAGLPSIDAAATSLCDVADSVLRGETPDWSPARVHIDVMRMLRHLPLDAPETRVMLLGLRDVHRKYCGVSPAVAP